VSRWFLEPAHRGDEALIARLRDAARRDDGVKAGVLHADNERANRGGFSLYVPEAADGRTPMPLVVALHGGSGHGRDFLWSWLADARSRQMLLLLPTARDWCRPRSTDCSPRAGTCRAMPRLTPSCARFPSAGPWARHASPASASRGD
jgi:phospholipase/carboxylesterase